jgi:hypothetical protein
MPSHSNNNPERKAIKTDEEKCAWNYFCTVDDDFACDERFVEPALCACFDDADLPACVVWLLWEEGVFA